MAFLSPEMEKAAHEAAFFFFYSISSEYQIERINPPNIFESIVVEVAWNQGQNFRTERKKLDRFSTFGENSWELGAGSWEPGAFLRPRHHAVPGGTPGCRRDRGEPETVSRGQRSLPHPQDQGCGAPGAF
jgi:hypothetical protein